MVVFFFICLFGVCLGFFPVFLGRPIKQKENRQQTVQLHPVTVALPSFSSSRSLSVAEYLVLLCLFVAVQRGSPSSHWFSLAFSSSLSLAPLLPDFAASGETVALFHTAAEPAPAQQQHGNNPVCSAPWCRPMMQLEFPCFPTSLVTSLLQCYRVLQLSPSYSHLSCSIWSHPGFAHCL